MGAVARSSGRQGRYGDAVCVSVVCCWCGGVGSGRASWYTSVNGGAGVRARARELSRITAPERCMGATHRRALMRSERRGSCVWVASGDGRVVWTIVDSVWRGGGWYVDVACSGHGRCPMWIQSTLVEWLSSWMWKARGALYVVSSVQGSARNSRWWHASRRERARPTLAGHA